ncbi:MAG: helix-turn-helix domain-containing protein [Actinobacteria bacterium]|nr:helix-turn-helix domain-containing protein [Actinomycetota bacterium]
MELSFEECYRAVASRDARFDGRFIVGVTSTGIYCRPSCPAPVTPKAANVRIFRTAAAAQAARLRACKRCLPDAAPGTPDWDLRADLAGRAMRLIADGAVDRAGVPGLARQLAVSERHLRRVLVDELGATPIELARSQRATTARVLIETTNRPFSEIAFAAGFSSIRQFNATVREVFDRTPTRLRQVSRHRPRVGPPGTIAVRLAHRTPFDARAMLRWFATRAIPGVEEVVDGTLRRTLRLPRGAATVELRPDGDHVLGTLRLDDLADLPSAVERCRRLLDLDADPANIAEVLTADPGLRPMAARRPGLRVPGTVDGVELAVRAVLGQQVSVAAARTMAARLVARCGVPLAHPDGTLTRTFPTAAAIADADLAPVGLTGPRQRTLRDLAETIAEEGLPLDGAGDRADVRQRLAAIPGIGPWTLEYITMRALRDPDAFPASDLGLRRRASALGLAGSGAELDRRAEPWRPWRAYAAQMLWTVDPNGAAG